MAKVVDWRSMEAESNGSNEPASEPTIRVMLAMQNDLLEKLHQAIVDLAINLEPIMRADPRSQDSQSLLEKKDRAQLIEDIERNNWQIEKAIGDVMAMQRLSAI